MSARCWRTSASRFNAYRRMMRCRNASTLCVAMLSLEIIVINLLVFIDSLGMNEQAVTVTTVCLSAFVLVLSLIISQLKYEQRAEEYHRCGVELADLEKRINIYIASGEEIDYETLIEFNSEYTQILRASNLNHATIDYEWAMRNEKDKTGVPGSSAGKRNVWQWIEYIIKCIGNGLGRIALWFKWHFGLTDSIYNAITVAGAFAIFMAVAYCKAP